MSNLKSGFQINQRLPYNVIPEQNATSKMANYKNKILNMFYVKTS